MKKKKNAAHVINQGKHDESIPQNEPQEAFIELGGVIKQ